MRVRERERERERERVRERGREREINDGEKFGEYDHSMIIQKFLH